MGDVAKAQALLAPLLGALKAAPRFGAKKVRHKDCTYLCGDSGPLAVAALVYNRLGPQYAQQQAGCVQRYVHVQLVLCTFIFIVFANIVFDIPCDLSIVWSF